MPTVSAYVSSHIITSGTWTTPENIYANDSSYATTPGQLVTTNLLRGRFASLNIPTGATINSVVFESAYKVSTTTSIIYFNITSGYNNGTKDSAYTQTTAEPLSDSVVTFTSIVGWTIEELNSGLAEILIAVTRMYYLACTTSINYGKITVDYTESAGLTKVLIDTVWKPATVQAKVTDIWKNVISVKENINGVWK